MAKELYSKLEDAYFHCAMDGVEFSEFIESETGITYAEYKRLKKQVANVSATINIFQSEHLSKIKNEDLQACAKTMYEDNTPKATVVFHADEPLQEVCRIAPLRRLLCPQTHATPQTPQKTPPGMSHLVQSPAALRAPTAPHSKPPPGPARPAASPSTMQTALMPAHLVPSPLLKNPLRAAHKTLLAPLPDLAVHEETNIAANTLFTSVVARLNLRLFLVISELLGY
jgi:hypothetical protein